MLVSVDVAEALKIQATSPCSDLGYANDRCYTCLNLWLLLSCKGSLKEQIFAHCGSWMAAIADETVNQFSIVKP